MQRMPEESSRTESGSRGLGAGAARLSAVAGRPRDYGG